jgi:hypothetical protein
MPITDPWGITYSPWDMHVEGPRKTMGIFYWTMGRVFDGPRRTMGIIHWPMGEAFWGSRKDHGHLLLENGMEIECLYLPQGPLQAAHGTEDEHL